MIFFQFHHLLGIAAIIGMLGICKAEVPDWEGRILERIRQVEGDHSAEAIDKLGRIVGTLASGRKTEFLESPAFKLARERLLEIPGFAEHFKQKILAISAWKNGESTVQTLESSGWYFIILAELPHPETVRVLGELLQDDRDPTNGASSDSPYVPNSVYASYALRNIGLKPAPTGRLDGDAWKEVATWRLWFEQVQHGKSFSFKGDTRTYTLAEKSKPATRSERRPRPKEGDTPSEPKKWADGPELLVILGLLLVTVTVAASKFLRRSIQP